MSLLVYFLIFYICKIMIRLKSRFLDLSLILNYIINQENHSISENLFSNSASMHFIAMETSPLTAKSTYV